MTARPVHVPQPTRRRPRACRLRRNPLPGSDCLGPPTRGWWRRPVGPPVSQRQLALRPLRSHGLLDANNTLKPIELRFELADRRRTVAEAALLVLACLGDRALEARREVS